MLIRDSAFVHALEELGNAAGKVAVPPRKELVFAKTSAITHTMNWREHILSDPQILRGKMSLRLIEVHRVRIRQ